MMIAMSTGVKTPARVANPTPPSSISMTAKG
jgi:hypothetical protein